MSDLITVWSPDGTEHQLTVANAEDMVRHNKWTRRPIGAPEPGDYKMEIPEAFKRAAERGPVDPSTLVKVFDRNGGEHMMNMASAMDMVRHLGWTTSEIVANRTLPIPSPAPVSEPVEEHDGIQSNANLNVPSEPAADKGKVSLADLSREELAVFAKENFDMEFGPEVSKEDIAAAIEAEM